MVASTRGISTRPSFCCQFLKFRPCGMPRIASSAIKALCSVCGRDMPLRSDGKVRIYRSVKNRCPGSENPPAPSANSFNTDQNPPRQTQASPISVNSVSPIPSVINPGRCEGKIAKRIPRAARHQTARKLSSILDNIVENNSLNAWERLFLFTRRCLQAPVRGGHQRSLASFINQAIVVKTDADVVSPVIPSKDKDIVLTSLQLECRPN